MKKVIIESPYKGSFKEIERNENYARQCLKDSLNRGEAPFASHLLYTQVLSDHDLKQRNQGINAGYHWGSKADFVAVYIDYGISAGMADAIEYYDKKGMEIVYRNIGKTEIEPISIVTFMWNDKPYRTKFDHTHVNRFFKMIDKNVTIPHRKICITDNEQGIDDSIETYKLWQNPCPRYAQTNENKPNCFYRIKMFDPAIEEIVGKRFVWMDLDAIVLDNIDNLLCDTANLKMWKVDGERMPCNGSFVMHKVGTRPELFQKFRAQQIHPVTGLKVAGMVGSDQAWIATQLTEAEQRNTFGMKDGIYSYRCHIKKMLDHGEKFPKDAKIVFFHGKENPWDSKIYHAYKWIQEAYS